MKITKEMVATVESLRHHFNRTPLEIFRTLVRVHIIQSRSRIGYKFPIHKVGRILGLDLLVIGREYSRASYDTGRGFRAALGVPNSHSKAHDRPQRYVVDTKDGPKIVMF